MDSKLWKHRLGMQDNICACVFLALAVLVVKNGNSHFDLRLYPISVLTKLRAILVSKNPWDGVLLDMLCAVHRHYLAFTGSSFGMKEPKHVFRVLTMTRSVTFMPFQNSCPLS